jgi:MoxR-like ATPase
MNVVERMTAEFPEVEPVLHASELLEMQRIADKIYVDPKVMEYSVTLANATRRPQEHGIQDIAKYVSYGGSPRASLNMILGAKALALLRGREFVMSEDVRDIAPEVLRHRFILSYEALADGVTPETLVTRVLEVISMPRVHMGDPYETRQSEPVPPAVG